VSRVDSNYARKPRDLYETPPWVVEAVLPHLPFGGKIWEPACGNGNIVRVLADAGYDVHASDALDGENFFAAKAVPAGTRGIITNPPYTDVADFIQHAIDLMMLRNGFVAMLLAADFDSAKSRRHLFADCRMFAKTIVLTRRIIWFERTDGKKPAPSENHRWFIWDWRHKGPPTIGYAP
jgi:hypothetical protein